MEKTHNNEKSFEIVKEDYSHLLVNTTNNHNEKDKEDKPNKKSFQTYEDVVADDDSIDDDDLDFYSTAGQISRKGTPYMEFITEDQLIDSITDDPNIYKEKIAFVDEWQKLNGEIDFKDEDTLQRLIADLKQRFSDK